MLRITHAIVVAVIAIASIGALGVGRTGTTERIRAMPISVIWIGAGEFTMGATEEDVRRGVRMCQHEHFRYSARIVWSCLHLPIAPGDEPLCRDDQGETMSISSVFLHEMGPHRVWLPSFGIDRTEVTVAAYDRCVGVGACPPAMVSLGTPQFGGAQQPIVGVRWDDAQAFCHWSHGRLPSEAEWERVARGHDHRPFPWGFQWDPRRANHGSLDPSHARLDTGGCYDATDGAALTAPVGSYPDGASPDGALDMAGNVWEWVSDLWHEPDNGDWQTSLSRYPSDANRLFIAPQGASHGAGHIIRGGGYDFPAFAMRTTLRWQAGAADRSLSIGFRCAYDSQ